jgi:hypothetical protein
MFRDNDGLAAIVNLVSIATREQPCLDTTSSTIASLHDMIKISRIAEHPIRIRRHLAGILAPKSMLIRVKK